MIKYTVWVRRPIRVEKGYYVSHFFFISGLQKCFTTILICKITWKLFIRIFYALLRILCYRTTVIIKDVSNIKGIGYAITIIKGDFNNGSNNFKRNKGFDCFSCALSIIPICFKIFIIISPFTSLHKRGD